MKKPAIPIVRSGNSDVDKFAEAVKQTLDTTTGQHQNFPRLKPLETTATTAETIARLNELLERLQGS